MLMQRVQPKVRKKTLQRRAVDPDMIIEVERLSALGLTREQIHNYYGMSAPSWEKRVERSPDLEMAISRGKARALEKVTGKLWEKIEQGNLSAIIFYLKTQARWREVDRLDEFGNLMGERQHPKITLTVHDPIEASKIYQQIMKGS